MLTTQLLLETLEALDKAKQLANIAGDWHLDEVEIDGEMVETSELAAEFAELLIKLRRATDS